MTESEDWLPVPGFEGRYEVSNLGRIKSLPRIERKRTGTPFAVRGRILKGGRNTDGYAIVLLSLNGIPTTRTVHRIVAEAFVPGRNELHNEVAHLDGSRTNSRADNLKWVSHRENQSHKFQHGTHPRGEQCVVAKLTESDVREIRAIQSTQGYRQELAMRFGVSPRTIDSVRNGTRWRHVQ